jgi:hypothetical protein
MRCHDDIPDLSDSSHANSLFASLQERESQSHVVRYWNSGAGPLQPNGLALARRKCGTPRETNEDMSGERETEKKK